MNVLVFFPIDSIVKALAGRLAAAGHRVEIIHAFPTFLRRLRGADWVLANASKHDSSRYPLKLALALLWARLTGRRAALFISLDSVDLCDRPLLRAVLAALNFVAFRSARLVMLLAARGHVARRYGLAEAKVVRVRNCPDPTLFPVLGQVDTLPRNDAAPLTFLYHGELLWWHGLERFLPIYEEIRQRRPARLIVTGNFYPTVFRVFGRAASRREQTVKRELAALLARPDVDYRGRVPLEELHRLMAAADFHVSLLNDEDLPARTELRTGLLEAMARGMACLHAATPALSSDLFRDGENIVLVDPRRAAAAAGKILDLAASPERLAALRRHASETIAAHFDLAREYEKAIAAMTSRAS